SLLLVVTRVNALRHPWEERLATLLSPETARWWSWALVLLPYLAGFGPLLPTLFFLGLLWNGLGPRQRVLAASLAVLAVTTPWSLGALDRIAAPFDESRAPLFGVPLIEHEAPSRVRD